MALLNIIPNKFESGSPTSGQVPGRAKTLVGVGICFLVRIKNSVFGQKQILKAVFIYSRAQGGVAIIIARWLRSYRPGGAKRMNAQSAISTQDQSLPLDLSSAGAAV